MATVPAVLTCALLLAACGRGTGVGAGRDGHDGHDALAAAEPIDRTGLVWAGDGVVHHRDGTLSDTGTGIDAFLVAGGGVFFTEAVPEDVAPADRPGRPELHYLPAGGGPGDVIATGWHPEGRSFAVSADGRYLGLVDRTDDLAVAVVVDLTTGEERVHSSRGMGDPDEDDLDDLYSELHPLVTAVDGEHAWVDTPDGELVFDLDSGKPVDEDGAAPPVGDAEPDSTNPSGTWSFRNTDGGPPVLRAIPDGAELPAVLTADGLSGQPSGGLFPPPITPLGEKAWTPDRAWQLAGWLDDEYAAGLVSYGDATRLVRCAVPSGECAVAPDSGDDASLPVG